VTPAPIPIVVDSDGGEVSCDALFFALQHPGLDVVAVTAAPGVVAARQAATNFGKVLAAAGRPHVPIAVGPEGRLGPAPTVPTPPAVADGDGLGGLHGDAPVVAPVAEPAPELLARLAGERPGELVVAALGPFGNLARALRGEPELAGRLRGLVAMGGALSVPGNATPAAEYNVAFDPTAASELLQADWPSPPGLISLDVTLRATLGPAELAALAARRTPAARFLAAPLERYARFATLPDGTLPTHDVLVPIAIAEPALIEWSTIRLDVDVTGGDDWGRTVASEDVALSARWRVAVAADVAGVRTKLRRFYGP
jgi:purine nucleosidase